MSFKTFFFVLIDFFREAEAKQISCTLPLKGNINKVASLEIVGFLKLMELLSCFSVAFKKLYQVFNQNKGCFETALSMLTPLLNEGVAPSLSLFWVYFLMNNWKFKREPRMKEKSQLNTKNEEGNATLKLCGFCYEVVVVFFLHPMEHGPMSGEDPHSLLFLVACKETSPCYHHSARRKKGGRGRCCPCKI